MFKQRIFWVIIIMTIILTACGINSDQPGEINSAFKRIFSIGSIIEANQELLLDEARTLSGIEVGPTEPFIQSQEAMIMQIDPMNVPALFSAIRNDIQDEIIKSGAEIVGSSLSSEDEPSEISYFSFSYRTDLSYGVINVWGVRGDSDNYIVITQITESMR